MRRNWQLTVLIGIDLVIFWLGTIGHSDYINVYQLGILDEIIPVVVLIPLGLILSVRILREKPMKHLITPILSIAFLLLVFGLVITDTYRARHKTFVINWIHINR